MLVPLVIVALLGLVWVMDYNKLIQLRQNAQTSWNGSETELTHRYDFIFSLLKPRKATQTRARNLRTGPCLWMDEAQVRQNVRVQF